MTLLRFSSVAFVCSLGLAGLGCAGGSSGTGTGGSSGAIGTAGNTGTAGTSGSAGTTGTAGTSATAGTTGGAGTTGVAGSTGPGNGGTTGAAGATGGAGTTGTAGTSGSAGTTGAAGSTAGSGGRGGSAGNTAGAGGHGGTTGTAGSTGTAGTTGTGGATNPHGSAAKLICPAGVLYPPSPLPSNPTINNITAPSPDYFAFFEGPVWIASQSTLFFSDNASSPTERIWKLVPPSTTPTIFVAASGSNGLGVDNSDQIIATIQRSPYGIQRFNPMTGAAGTKIATTAKPNDVIVRSDDNVYFTDPDTGFYRIAPNGTISAAMKFTQSSRPNGIELSTDENTLYVGDVGNKTIVKYTLAADGTVMTSTGALFVSATMHDTVDGMCTDCAGNVYAGTSGGVEVYSSAGTYIGTIATGESSNCTFAGADRKTMYVTSRATLKYVTLNIPGLPD
jgi:sugar lactone lactonase YvrE